MSTHINQNGAQMASRDEKGRWLVGHGEAGPGRKSKYEPWMNEEAHRLALLGLTDEQVAGVLGISHETFYAWMHKYSAFSEAIHSGKTRADAKVAESLFKRATGMTVRSEKAMKNKAGEVVIAQTVTEIPPDTAAAARWLGNRQRALWADRKPEEPPPDDPGAPANLADMPDDELRERLEMYRRRRESEKG